MESWNKKLLIAAGRGDNKSVEECLENGAQVNNKGLKEWTPLHWAAREGHGDTVATLISHGGDINSESSLGYTPLHLAAMWGHTDIVVMIISHDGDTNSKSNMGWTALHQAAFWGHTDTVDKIILHGGDIYIKDNNGKTPYDVAKKDKIKELIKSNGKKGIKTVKPDNYLRTDPSVMLNRLLGEGSSESYDIRVMVAGQFGVGKTSLVMILVGENVPKIKHSTDGISLLEGRCGLGIEQRDWIIIDKDDYNAFDVVYNKVLTSSDETNVTVKVTPTQEHQTASINQPAKEQRAIFSDAELGALPKTQVQSLQLTKARTKMTKDEIRKKMDQVLKSGKYTLKIGRLIFWDFGGQYVYYTTHQSFMTYRALFMVVFDGSKSLNEKVHDVVCFPGQDGTPTPAVFLQHWVNSILTYCKELHPGTPQILFIATHKDKIPKELVEKKRRTMYNEIENLFRHHEGRHHLVMEHRLFVNATDKHDPEIFKLKKIITDLTFRHPCWGERMPNTWVPLELEISELAAEGQQILSLEEVEDLNKSSEILVLPEKDLKFFLQFQHSLGKIVYFDTPQLRDFVIISPLFMVEVMKSFVTAKQFWPKDKGERQPFERMSRYGIIKKTDLFSIWEKQEFAKILLHKEFLFDMLVHLDILSEQRRYDVKTGSRLHVDEYFVPCMMTRINTSRYIEKECTPKRAIGLAFVFKGTIIPPALPNRLISACLSMWSVKEYNKEKLFFSGFVVLSRDMSHDIMVCVQSNRILVYIIHRSSKGLIVSDIATGVRECMHSTLQRISEFYRSTVSHETSNRKLPFHVEFACSDLKCYVPETIALGNKARRCTDHGNKIEVDVWYQDKYVYKCDINCEGLSQDALGKIPSDAEILRLSSKLDPGNAWQLGLHLGMEDSDWKDLEYNYPRDCAMVKFIMLIKWRNSMNGTFKHIADALTTMDIRSHILCQVRRIKRNPTELPEEHLDAIPTDEILDALAPEIGKVSFQLGIELGRSVPELEAIQYDYHDLVTQTKKILYNWRNDLTMKATLCVLEQALMNVGRGSMCLKNIVDELGVKKQF